MLKANIISNYLSQIYIAGIGILLLPLYVHYMGAESYGLVGFFSLLQSWFNILDLGLTPTISRETARYKSGATSEIDYKKFLNLLSYLFISVALIGGGILFSLSNDIALYWLKPTELTIPEVVFSVQVMSISVALRWLSGLYRGIITGHEKLVILSSINAVIATFRFVIVFGVMWVYGFTPKVFFQYQLIIVFIELIVLIFYSNTLTPKDIKSGRITLKYIKSVSPLLKFSLTIAFTSSIWILVTQTDKFVLSGILSLKDYGYFTIAVLVANGIMIINTPISTAIMPRLANLYAKNKVSEAIEIYKLATRLVCILVGSFAITIIFFPDLVIYAWSGDIQLTLKASPILRLYIIGNIMLVISAFPYYIQYAQGNLKYHLIGNIGMAILFIPLVIFASLHFGGIGSGYVWIFVNIIFLFLWVPYVHRKVSPGVHRDWFLNDILSIISLPIIISITLYFYLPRLNQFPSEYGRLYALFTITIISLINLLFSLLISKYKNTFKIVKKNEQN
ncbi:lipopolysaccharide biosynthesis protein [Morganella morganii]|uniref:lipopolysaccharide biosynthesis protein n=1 Tax=Morganella TaxID=581 RepID=UPI00370A3848